LFSELATKNCENRPWSSFGQVAAEGTHRTQEVAGSSPASSTRKRPAKRALHTRLRRRVTKTIPETTAAPRIVKKTTFPASA